MEGIPLGRFCWHELLTSDPEGAQAFYKDVIGWSTQAWEGGGEPYTMWMTSETAVGGVMRLPPPAVEAGAPPHWVTYVAVSDADGVIERTTSKGGTLVWGPEDIPEIGRVAFLADPQGAHFAIHQPAGETPGHDGPARVGEMSWHELATLGWEAAWDFYSDLFGWEKTEAMDMGEMGTYQMFGRGAQPLGGMFDKPPQVPVPNWLPYVRVSDIAAAVLRVKEAGGQLLNGPMEVPGGDLVAQCADPQGAMFALHETAQGS